MLFEFPADSGPDRSERAIPDVAAARAIAGASASVLDNLVALRFAAHGERNGTAADIPLQQRTAAAVQIAFARLGLRHGSFGDDWHTYHNESHVLEILDGRIARLLAAATPNVLSQRDVSALLLFAAGHDLRQREPGEPIARIGANERASLGETFRILDHCGFSREDDRGVFVDLELMIAGSTFHASRPAGARALNPAELVQASGALAPELGNILDEREIPWRDDDRARHALDLALIAADLDTANVAEPFADFAASSERLCREREMLSGRSLDAVESAEPVLGFLSDGQEDFFFVQHRFHSRLGMAAFADAKTANAAPLRRVCHELRSRMAAHAVPSGTAVITAFRDIVAKEISLN